MTVLAFLFVFLSVVMAVVIYLGMMDTDLMPLSCPCCYRGGDRDMIGLPRPWYRRAAGDSVYCFWCHTFFREHPNGTLVEDRPVVDDQ